MKNALYVIALFALIAFAHTMAYQDEQQEEETMLAYDPIPWANGGLGCITDSECEGVK